MTFNFLLFAESTLQKLDGLRQEVRNADRKKREVSSVLGMFEFWELLSVQPNSQK